MRTKQYDVEAEVNTSYQHQSQQSEAVDSSTATERSRALSFTERSRAQSFTASSVFVYRGSSSLMFQGIDHLSGYFNNSHIRNEDGKTSTPNAKTKESKKWTRHQWGTLCAVLFVDFCACLCISILAPFFPREAEHKGISTTAAGMVFGVFSLVILILSPIYGKYIGVIGTKFLFNAGTLLTGICIIAFGLLDRVPAGDPFLYTAMAIRVIGAFGDAAIFCASYVIMPHVFPDSVATVYAAIESAFALGLIAGPAIGGFLYEIGGYVTPFAVNGACLILSAGVTYFLLPSIPRTAGSSGNWGMLRMLRNPYTVLYGFVTFASAFSGGFIAALLEPHLKQFGLSPSMEGLVFSINGIVYAFTAPLWGIYCDRSKNYSVPCLVAVILMIISWSLLGPCDFLPIPVTLTLNVIGLCFYGVAWSGELIAAAAGITANVIGDGFPDSVETFGLVSGLINAMFALGASTGPVVAGVLYDATGKHTSDPGERFSHSSMSVYYLHIFVGLLLGFSVLYNFLKRMKIIGPKTRVRSALTSDTSPLLVSGPV